MSKQTESPKERMCPMPEHIEEALNDLYDTLQNEEIAGITILITQEEQTRVYHFSNTKQDYTEYFFDVQARSLRSMAEDVKKNNATPVPPIYLGKAGEA